MLKVLLFFFISGLNGEYIKISDIIENPDKFRDKEVLVQGEITDVCKGSGCWIEVKQGEHRIIVKSFDHKILFPSNSTGKKVKIKGIFKILEEEIHEKEHKYTKEHGEKEAHKCPHPEFIIEVKGFEIIGGLPESKNIEKKDQK
jgi:hypothetical protein